MGTAKTRTPPAVAAAETAGAGGNTLSELGEKIFLDRYALKDASKKSLAVGDTVVVCTDVKTGQREIGTVEDLRDGAVEVRLRDGSTQQRAVEHVDKPFETRPEEMMERVARGIAKVEGARAAEWERNFQWLLDGWKFVPAGRILTAAGSQQALTYYNCMPPDQEILTAAGYLPIGDVEVGDLVVTHRNRLRPVLHKFERDAEEPIYALKARKLNYDLLRVTGEHKVLAIRSEWVNTHRGRDGLRLSQEPEWIRARDLKPGDFVAAACDGERAPVPAIHVSEHVSGYEISEGKLGKPTTRGEHGHVQDWGTHYAVNDRLVPDDDLCYLFGRWLGDGCVTHRTKTDIPSGIKIVFALDEREEAEKAAALIEAKFGVPASVKLSSTERWLDVWANSMPLGQFFKAFFGCYSYGKRIPAPLTRLPDDLTLSLLRGLFRADGYTSDHELGMLLANKVLSIQVHQLLLRLGYFFSINENTHRLARHPAYRVHATANECGELFRTFFGVEAPKSQVDLKYYIEHDGLLWVRIEAISIEEYAGPVLDIEVEEDHSFVSAGLVVSNCYVIPSPEDARKGIVETLEAMMEIMSRGGGVGINISSLRPRHAYVRGVNGRSSGSVSWGALYSFVTGLIEQGGSRRGALMLILNCWHPDVVDFINAKREAGKITNANISVGITDDFMAAVEADKEWELVFPDTGDPTYDAEWDGNLDAWRAKGKPVVVHKTRPAREIWNSIIESAWASGEPGVFFVDRYNRMSNSWYYAPIMCTNPCGEQGLPAWGVCNLGAINLAKFVSDGQVQWNALGKAIRYAIRFLDDVIDATPYFFDENQRQQQSERRVGLNTMGLAEMLIRVGIRYGSAECERFLDELYEFIARESYGASADLAVEKGAFPAFEADKFLQSGYMQGMPEDLRATVREKGMRNVTLLTQAPNGTIGTMVGTSTGVEPYYSWTYFRKSRLGVHEENVGIVQEWEEGNPGDPLPDYFVTAMDLTPEEHVRVQATVQRWIDSSISKTCNVPNSYTVEQTRQLYELMYRLGCKGGTIYRDGSRDEQVLHRKEKEPAEAMVAVATVVDEPKVRPRPYKRYGVTVSKKTPAGTAHITMNNDEEDRPFEVFVDIGKGGTDVKAMAEAIGRLMSLVLRIASPLSPLERIREMINQMKGIGGARWVGFGRDRVRSFPDAVAQALEEHYGVEGNGNGNGHVVPDEMSGPVAEAKTSVAADLCPNCGQAAFVHEEGCMTCHACGHSEC